MSCRRQILSHYVSLSLSSFIQQESQLDFLLSKASEYSNFISKDLEDLQHAMAENARKKMEKAEKRSKKGKKGGDEPARKKRKGDAGEKLKTALVKDAVVRAGGKPIFVQPYNLADGCYLKDYQLEGVRWLASLFENGVSGILADEVRVRAVEQNEASCRALLSCRLLLANHCPFFSGTSDGSGKDDSGDCLDCPSSHHERVGALSGGCTTCYLAELGAGIRKVAPDSTRHQIPRYLRGARGHDERTFEPERTTQQELPVYCDIVRNCHSGSESASQTLSLLLCHC